MDQDFYIEESSPIKVIITIIIFMALIAGGIYFYMDYKTKDNIKLKNVTVELGDKLSTDISTYITGNNIDTYSLDISNISVDEDGKTNSTGEYSYKIKKNGEVKKGKLYVKDTIKPSFKVEDLNVGVNEDFNPNDFLIKCEDLSLPCSVKFKKVKDLELNKEEGTYKTTIIISDAAGNEEVQDVNLIVSGEGTLAKKKASNLEFDHLSEEDTNWDKTYTLKLDKGINEESIEYNDAINLVSTKEYEFSKSITDKKILVIYNKYNYVIGFSVKVTFDDNSYIYITKDNATEKEITNEEEN